MLRIISMSILLGSLITALVGIEACTNTTTIDVLFVKGYINPVISDYIRRGIEHSEDTNAVGCVIELNTSGGSGTAMREIVRDVLKARVPVVVYISPSGSKAVSVGVFITMAAHVAVMAPNTVIGAANPVSIWVDSKQKLSETMQEKIFNDAVAYLRSITEVRGRNTEWAEQTVRESVSANEREALEIDVIDMVASDLEALISQLDGVEIALLDGRVVTLDTQSTVINFFYNKEQSK